MSDPRSVKDRVEKRRISVENDTIKLNFLKTLERLGFAEGDPKNNLKFHMAYLSVTIQHDFSGREWDDDYSPEDGGNA